jgi:hypothetical protein
MVLSSDYMEAESSYSQALQMCPACFQKDRSVLFSNRAAARMKQVGAGLLFHYCMIPSAPRLMHDLPVLRTVISLQN